MFIAVLFILAKFPGMEASRVNDDEQINKMWYMQVGMPFSFRRKETLSQGYSIDEP